MSALELEGIEPWASHPSAAPRTCKRNGDDLVIAANGTRTCCGGWQMVYAGATAGQAYALHVDVAYEGLDCPRDALECVAYWGELPPTQAGQAASRQWHYLTPRRTGDGAVRFAAQIEAPQGAERLTLRCVFRWSAQGSSVWRMPEIALARPQEPKSRVARICVVTGTVDSRPKPPVTIQANLAYYGGLCERACERKPNLIVLPEIALQWQVPGHSLDLAVEAPGPETDLFARIAAQARARIAVGMLERDGDAVFNSVVLISPEGRIDGKYHKVHLAVRNESHSGVLPGDGFPVFETEIGRVGCNICMDSSACESSRMAGLNGADFLLLPIMGDHRASRLSPGKSLFNESRWRAIMRTRAMDNQLCLAVARNNGQGSCIVDRMGKILAWNEGDRDIIGAAVARDDGYRAWNGGCFREVNWMQRRPHLYHAFVDPDNLGPLR